MNRFTFFNMISSVYETLEGLGGGCSITVSYINCPEFDNRSGLYTFSFALFLITAFSLKRSH